MISQNGQNTEVATHNKDVAHTNSPNANCRRTERIEYDWVEKLTVSETACQWAWNLKITHYYCISMKSVNPIQQAADMSRNKRVTLITVKGLNHMPAHWSLKF